MKYPGAKTQHMQMLINHIPPHRIYIEPFLGSGALLLKKRKAEKSIGIDIDEGIIKKFQAIPASDEDIFLCQDACDFLMKYEFSGDEFLFVDPPYLISTRRQKKIYRHEIDYAYHLRLLNILLNLDIPIMLAGYTSPLYDYLLSSWRCVELKQKIPKGDAVEMIWMNYPSTHMLHDYRHIGNNYRQREKFSRRQITMRQKYSKLTPWEQNAFKEWVMESKDKHACQ